MKPRGRPPEPLGRATVGHRQGLRRRPADDGSVGAGAKKKRNAPVQKKRVDDLGILACLLFTVYVDKLRRFVSSAETPWRRRPTSAARRLPSPPPPIETNPISKNPESKNPANSS